MQNPPDQNHTRYANIMPDKQGLETIEKVFRQQIIASEQDIHRAQGLINALSGNDYINWIDLDYILKAFARLEQRPINEDGYELFPTNISMFLAQLRLFVEQEQDRIQKMIDGLHSLGKEA